MTLLLKGIAWVHGEPNFHLAENDIASKVGIKNSSIQASVTLVVSVWRRLFSSAWLHLCSLPNIPVRISKSYQTSGKSETRGSSPTESSAV